MIQIRAAEIKDLPSIQEILNDQILYSCNVYDETPRTGTQMREWFEHQFELNNPILVATDNSKVIGYASYSQFRKWEGFRFCMEHSIYLSKEARGRGAGKLLLMELLNIAKERNVHSIIAGIDGQNKKGIAFHLSMGFDQVGEIKQSGYKFNQWLDLVLMQLILK
jgi:L-amino acid N-acyltransferase YncA